MLDQFSEIIYFAKGVVRNKWIITIVACLICIGGWTYVYRLPFVYESSARVHVDTRTMLRPLLRGLAVQSDIRGLIAIMKKLMFTQQNLMKVAELAGMELDKESDLKMEAVLDKLRTGVVIEGGREEIFKISYSSYDPQNSKDVVQAVLTVFSEQTQQSTLSDVDSAQRFIDNQIREYEKRLRNAESAKENFKRDNIGLLPGREGAGQIGEIQVIRQQLADANMQKKEMQSRKSVLQKQLDEALESGEEWGLTEFVSSDTPEDSRIAELESRKEELLLKYTENHPNIVSIDFLIQEMLRKKKENEPDIDSESMFKAMSNPYVQSIKIELNRIDTELATINSRIMSFKNKLLREDEQFNARLKTETEMQNLNRDYESIKKNYLELIDRREQARMSSQVDNEVSALKFKIVDPANLPIEPASPKRKLLYSLIFAGGFIIGSLIALMKVFIRPTFVEAKQLKELTGLPILGTISEVVNEAQASSNLYRLVKYISVNVLLLLGYSGFMIADVVS